METMRQLDEAEHKLATETAFVRRDTDHRSDRFEFVTIKNSQTIFFERIGDDIVIVAAGWSGRNWKERLEEMQPYIDQQINKLHKLKSHQ